MSKKNNKTIGKLSGSRRLWTVKPIVKIVPSGKVYKRNKRVKETEKKYKIYDIAVVFKYNVW